MLIDDLRPTKPVSKSQQAGNRTPRRAKKPSYDIRIRGEVPDDLVNRISELHAKTILMAGTSILDIQDGPETIPGDEKVQKPLRSVPAKKSVLNSEESQE